MAYDIGPKIGIDGEAEFRRSIQQVSQNIKTLGSEMSVVTAQYARNADSQEALSAKSAVLNKQIEAQKEKAGPNILSAGPRLNFMSVKSNFSLPFALKSSRFFER